MAYDKRYAECRMMETHEESQLVKLDGNRYHIDLELNNAKVVDSKFSKNSNSLILNLDTLDDGLISITIPRDLYNYPEEIPSHIPFILQNGEEIGYADFQMTLIIAQLILHTQTLQLKSLGRFTLNNNFELLENEN